MGYGSKQWQDWVLDEEDSLPLIEHAYKQGINTWDTVSEDIAILSVKCPNKLLTVDCVGGCLLPRQIRRNRRKSLKEVQHPS